MTQFPPELVEEWRRRIRASPGSQNAHDASPHAGEPQRIAILGWAWLANQEREGTGLNLSVSELAAELARRGHEVYYLRAGIACSVKPGMRIPLQETWRGVGCFQMVNGSNLAPAVYNFKNVEAQIEAREQSELIADWAAAIEIDVVHIHSFEGFGFDVVRAIKARGIPVVVTPHNYYALCPQVDLMHAERSTCEDYDGGRRCVECIRTPDPERERRHRARRTALQRIFGESRGESIWRAADGITMRFDRMLRGEPDHEHGASAPASRDAPMPISPADQNERLLNASGHLRVLHDYGRRRAAGVAALTASDRVLCPSQFLRNVHAAMGADPRRLTHVALGQPHFDAIRAHACRSKRYHQRLWSPEEPRPLRVGYFGSTKPNKGLDTFCRGLAAMDPASRARTRCVIRASGDVEPWRVMLREIPEAEFLGGYTPDELPVLLGEIDVGVMPNMGLENSPFVLLEYLHAGLFALTSRLGAPPDWIREPINGVMFPAGDAHALAQLLTSIVRGQTKLPTPADVHASLTLRTFAEYVNEVEGTYRDVCRSRHHAHAAL